MAFEFKEVLNGQSISYTSPTFDGLVKAVYDRRRKEGKRTADYNLIHNELKRKLQPKNYNQKKYITPQEAINGAKAVFLQNIVLNNVESQKEIDRRSAICERCPALSAMAGCSKGCGISKIALDAYNATVNKFFGGARYNIPTRLKKTYCGVCGCSSAAILPAKLEHFLPDSEEKARIRPANCWLHNRNTP